MNGIHSEQQNNPQALTAKLRDGCLQTKDNKMNENALIRALLFATVLTTASLADGQEQQRLEYRSSLQPHPLVGMLPPKALVVISERPQGVQLLDLKSAHPLFAKWLSPLAPNGSLWVILDRASKEGSYDILFIDSNADNSLKDETAVVAHFSNESRAQFGPIEVALKGREGAVAHHLSFEFVLQADGPRLNVRSGGWYEDDITVGGKQKHCVLLDQNANGLFNDKAIDLKDCDLIQLGKEGDPDVSLVGNFVQVDENLHRLEVSPNGTWVRLTEATNVEFGAVKPRPGGDMTELVAGGENGMLTVKLEKDIGKLPVGKYRVYGWDVDRQDGDGNPWKAKATSFGNPEVFEISEGKETRLDVGEPIVSTIETYRSGAQCTIRHAWRGKADEHIQLTRNEVPPPPAQVHIWNADRSYDRTFTFEHG